MDGMCARRVGIRVVCIYPIFSFLFVSRENGRPLLHNCCALTGNMIVFFLLLISPGVDRTAHDAVRRSGYGGCLLPAPIRR